MASHVDMVCPGTQGEPGESLSRIEMRHRSAGWMSRTARWAFSVSPLALAAAMVSQGSMAAPVGTTAWQVAGPSSWFIGSNWSAGIPAANVDANVTNDGTAQVSSGTAAAAQLTVTGASVVQVTGGATLSVSGTSGTGTIGLNNGRLQASTAGTFDTAIDIGPQGGTIDSNGANFLTVSGNIAGASGTLFFTGTNGDPNRNFDTVLTGTNSFSGTVVIAPGTQVVSTSTNGLGSGALDVTAGGVFAMGAVDQAVTTLTGNGNIYANGFRFSGPSGSSLDTLTVQNGNFGGVLGDGDSHSASDNYTGTLRLQKVGAGTLALSNSNNYYSGGTDILGGTIEVTADNVLGTGTITLNGGTLQSGVAAEQGITLNNAIAIGANGGTIDSNGADAFGLKGPITGTGPLVIKNSTVVNTGDFSVILSGSNTSTGGLTIEDNTQVVVNADNAAGLGSLSLNGQHAKLSIGSSYTQFVTSLAGDGLIYAGGYRSPTGSGIGTLTVQSGSFAGDLKDGQTHSSSTGGQFTGTLQLVKTSPGILTLSGTSTYSGPTTVLGGNLVAGSPTAFSQNSSYNIAGAGTLDVHGNNVGIEALSGSGLVTNAGTFASLLTIGNNNSSTVFSGIVQDGSAPLALKKVGSGTLVLGGSNTFSAGTLLQGGTLGFTNSTLNAGAVVSSSLGTGAVTFNGGTLQFDAPNTLVEVGNTIVVGPGGGTIDSNGSYPRISADIVNEINPGVLTFANSVGRVGENIDIILYGRNTTTGGAVVANGVDVSLGTANGIGLGPLTVNGSFNLGSQNQAVTTLAGSGGYIYATGLGAPTGSSTSILTVQSGDYGGGLYDGTGTYGSTTQGKLGLTKVSDGSASGGTLRLFGATGTGRFAYSGLTDIVAGRLLAGSAEAFSPKSAVQIEAAGSLDLGGFSNTVASLSGRGTVTNSGTTSAVLTLGGSPGAAFGGTVTDGIAPVGLMFMGGAVMAGTNTYSGPTTIASGVVQAGAQAGLSPNSAFDIASGAALDLGGYSNSIASLSGSGSVFTSGGPANLTVGRNGLSTTFSGTLSDGTSALSLTKIGVGTLTLAGANSYSGGTFLDGGTLALGNAAALGTGALTMAPGTTLAAATDLTIANPIVFAAAGDPTIDTGANTVVQSGAISGPGNLTKTGTGTLDLAALNTYTGGTDVAQGTLLVTGSAANSTVTVENGARLGGGGTIGGLNLLSGATLAPGLATPFSTLTVAGNASLQSGSTYVAAIGPGGQSDRLVVGGVATLNGAALTVNATGLGFTPNTRYALLTAAGGVTGQFGTVTTGTNLAFLSPSISYAPGTADLTFVQATPLASAAATPNQRAVAAAIDGLGPGNRLYDAVVGLDAAGARQAFQAASGETHASATTSAVQATRVVSSIVFDRLWNLPIPQAGDALDALKQFEPHNVPTLLNCYAPTTAPATGVRQGSGYTVWGQAIGDFGSTAGDGNAGAVDRTLGGFVLGIDSRVDAKALENWRVGAAAGYTNTQFSVKSGGGDGTFENVFGTLYAGARYGNVTLRFGGTYGGTQTNSRRSVAFPGFFETERSNNGGETAQAFGEIGYRISTPSLVVEPIFNGAITHTHQDGYREKGGDAALVGAAQDVDVGSTVLGFRSEMLPFGSLPLVARVFLGWQHTYGDINPAATLAFAAGGPSFNSYGAPLDRNAVVAEAGLDWRVTAAVSLGLTYFGQAGERSTDNALKGRMEYRF